LVLGESMKKALITGITGQDGSYLAELLLSKGYEVYGLVRRSSSFNTERLEEIYQDPHSPNYRLRLVYGDMEDGSALANLIKRVHPDEVYNLAAQSHVRVSFDMPEYTAECTGVGCLRVLEALRTEGLTKTRFYQASSSELYGKVREVPQSEKTPFHPRSPYANAKAFAFYTTLNFREAYGMHAVNGILFNHESPRRGETFVTRKVTRAAGRIKLGLQKELFLGNLDARRDWGYAKDFVEAMWLAVQHDRPDDFVVATGESHSVRELCEEAFGRLDLDYRDFVKLDPRYLRPAEVDHLLGDSTKASRLLGWKPRTTFKDLITLMVESDLELARREARR